MKRSATADLSSMFGLAPEPESPSQAVPPVAAGPRKKTRPATRRAPRDESREGALLAQAGGDAAVRHADPAQLQSLVEVVQILAGSRASFTSDDVWFHVQHSGLHLDLEPRALGPVLVSAVRKGMLASGPLVASKRKERHRGWVREYVSLVYRAEATHG